ncbi:uncharacterized protein CTHT_0017200 [Thermochaetoides thermophila DSM 1495]|uniref:Uncharacterized protein n=1 Tax=Chaetomium thermophilum (strain DSM 1495 / CBS 144.50 / IMI 039719) TaxID=759272 RepID=G0S2H0_CHATD|nr:hypothetical protein CTHT_0017200 [Thermochaetoides thermophila DSM 1495]EGS22203.1 hypothetical protein CTHT_0017200 [Thermochaetoides thermophila DSM 1495]
MKFFAAVLAFAAVAVAYPSVPEHNAPVKRQNIVTNIDVSVPAMTDSQGNVVPFDATKVYLAAKANGL